MSLTSLMSHKRFAALRYLPVESPMFTQSAGDCIVGVWWCGIVISPCCCCCASLTSHHLFHRAQNNQKAMLTYNVLSKITDFTRKMDNSEPYVPRAVSFAWHDPD